MKKSSATRQLERDWVQQSCWKMPSMEVRIAAYGF